jgi:hypothetical protein
MLLTCMQQSDHRCMPGGVAACLLAMPPGTRPHAVCWVGVFAAKLSLTVDTNRTAETAAAQQDCGRGSSSECQRLGQPDAFAEAQLVYRTWGSMVKQALTQGTVCLVVL